MTATASRPSWWLDNSPTAPRTQGSWVERSGFEFGQRARWLERTIDAATGSYERRYLESPIRDADVFAQPIRLEHGGAAAHAPRSSTGASARRGRAVVRSAAVSRVRMTEHAWDSMVGYKQYVDTTFGSELRGIGDGFELGGALFGGFDGDEIVVNTVTGRVLPDPTRHSAHIDLDYIDDVAERSPHQLVGIWHSHSSIDGNLGPGRAGFARPSGADLKCWNSLQRHSRKSTPIVGLILSPVHNDVHGWTSPLATCVIARGDDDVQSAEYVRIEVEGHPGRCADLPDRWRL
jgi:hypothetical protein